MRSECRASEASKQETERIKLERVAVRVWVAMEGEVGCGRLVSWSTVLLLFNLTSMDFWRLEIGEDSWLFEDVILPKTNSQQPIASENQGGWFMWFLWESAVVSGAKVAGISLRIWWLDFNVAFVWKLLVARCWNPVHTMLCVSVVPVKWRNVHCVEETLPQFNAPYLGEFSVEKNVVLPGVWVYRKDILSFRDLYF